MDLKKYILISLIVLMSGTYLQVQAKCDCDEDFSKNPVSSLNFNEEQRYPQTILHDLVMNFISEREDDREKKVLVLGYDGFKEDALGNIFPLKQSAIKEVANTGGIYHSYAGANGKQETSTAPGWLSILYGDWAYKVGVVDNTGIKPKQVPTFLSEALSLGYTSTFIASWPTHFDLTYSKDIKYQEGNHVYQQTNCDEETLQCLQTVLNDTSSQSYDVIFATLEYTDHAGHAIGYGNEVEAYKEASQQVDQEAYQLLQTIYNRPTYENEDWLIILTTDHGGIETSHGGQSEDETNTWFAINQPIETLLTFFAYEENKRGDFT